MSWLALSNSFEYLCHRSTAIRNISSLSVRGSTLGVRIWRLQTSDSDDWSRCPRCKGLIYHLTSTTWYYPFTRRCRIYSGFHFLLAHQVPHFNYVKDKMWHQPARFEKSWPPFCQIWIIFTHLKLRIASAGHNFKWVKIQIEYFGG